MRQIFGDVGWEMKALVFFLATAIFVLIGPFGTYEDLTLSERIVFWFVVVGGVGFFMHVAMTIALRAPRLRGWPRWACVVLGSAVAALPGAAVVEFVNEVFRPSGMSLQTLVRLWFQVTVIGSVIGIVEYIDWRGTPADQPAPVLTRFHKRLPSELGHDIISISMEDHYARITTTLGQHMLLMRLSDVMAELGDGGGLQVHRSHWVALPHLRDVEKSGTRHFARLSDGRSLPVSATYLPAVQEHLA